MTDSQNFRVMMKQQMKTSGQKSRKEHNDFDQATSMRRPFKQLYKECKWLNAYAIINDVAIQELMKDFESMFFLEKDCSILKENIKSLID